MELETNMAKTKTHAEVPDKASPGPTIQKQLKPPRNRLDRPRLLIPPRQRCLHLTQISQSIFCQDGFGLIVIKGSHLELWISQAKEKEPPIGRLLST
jgi:hypothetical protein